MISIKQLTYALAVEKTLHFKKAAELSNISQSALSTALHELEKQLGLQIFERDNKKVLVTPVGKRVLEKARDIMLQVEDLQHLADSQRAPLSFPMTIGAIPTICPYLLPRIFPLLNQRYPDGHLNIVEEQSHVLVDMVARGEIDTAILALPIWEFMSRRLDKRWAYIGGIGFWAVVQTLWCQRLRDEWWLGGHLERESSCQVRQDNIKRGRWRWTRAK